MRLKTPICGGLDYTNPLSFSQLACSVKFSRQIRQNLQCSIVEIIDQPGQSDKKIWKAGIPKIILIQIRLSKNDCNKKLKSLSTNYKHD